MPTGLLASDLLFATAPNLLETGDSVHPQTDDHVRETVSASGDPEASAGTGDRETSGPTQSGFTGLSEADDIVRARLSQAHVLRAHHSKSDVRVTQGVPEEVRPAACRP